MAYMESGDTDLPVAFQQDRPNIAHVAHGGNVRETWEGQPANRRDRA